MVLIMLVMNVLILITYRGSEVTDDGEHLHYVTVHNTHKDLDDYPEYKR